MCTRRKNSWNLQMFFSFPPTVYLRDSCGPSRFTELLLCRILHTFSGLHSTGCGDCELGLPKYFKIPILCPVNSNTADCIYWRTDFCISHYSWTPEKRLHTSKSTFLVKYFNVSIQERIFDVLWIFIINIKCHK